MLKIKADWTFEVGPFDLKGLPSEIRQTRSLSSLESLLEVQFYVPAFMYHIGFIIWVLYEKHVIIILFGELLYSITSSLFILVWAVLI